MAAQAFIDDSGGKNQGSAFVFAGWMGEADDLAAFSEDWARCLSRPPKIQYFKMDEAALLKKEFRGVADNIRDKKLRDLLKIIRDHKLVAYWCITDLDAFAKGFARSYLPPMNHPYFWPFQMTIMGICADLANKGYREPAEIIFDKQEIFEPRVKEWYPKVRDAMEDDTIRSVLPLKLSPFRDDRECLPLQAADMLAWLTRKSLPTSGNNPFAWLWGELSEVEYSQYSQVIDRDRMKAILERSYSEVLGRQITLKL